jgi:amino acid transporter
MIGIGALIGGGIFSLLGLITIFAGPYSYISYAMTGTVTLLTVYSYEKLTLKWSSPGGEYIAVQNAFSGSKFQKLAPVIGVLLYLGFICSMALYSYTFSIHALLLFNLESNLFSITIVSVLLISFFMLLNLKGISATSRMQNVLVIIKVVILIIFIVFGLAFALRNPQNLAINLGFTFESLKSVNIGGILFGGVSIIISYEGFQLISYEVNEMKDVNSGLRMMKWAVFIVMILYVFIALVALGVIGVSGLIGLGQQDAQVGVAMAANQFLGVFGIYIVITGALVATASALNATILGSSRLAYMLAKEKVFPGIFSRISKAKVPSISILITSIISILLTIIIGGILAIAGIVSIIFSQIYFIINFTNYKVRKQTNSNALIPLISMVLTASYLVILIVFNIVNFKTELMTLIVVTLIEMITIVVVLQKKKNEQQS